MTIFLTLWSSILLPQLISLSQWHLTHLQSFLTLPALNIHLKLETPPCTWTRGKKAGGRSCEADLLQLPITVPVCLIPSWHKRDPAIRQLKMDSLPDWWLHLLPDMTWGWNCTPPAGPWWGSSPECCWQCWSRSVSSGCWLSPAPPRSTAASPTSSTRLWNSARRGGQTQE